MIVKYDHLRIRSLEMMPTNFFPHIVRDGDAALLTSDVVNSLDLGCPPVTVCISNDQVLLGERLGEVEAAAEKRVPIDRRAERGGLLRPASLDCGFHTRDVILVLRTKVDRVPFQAGQDDGLNQFGIIGHHNIQVLYHPKTEEESVWVGEVSAET
jgi:hypothetical protein